MTGLVLGAKPTARSDLFDAAFTLREEQKVLNPDRRITLQLFTNGKNLFEVLSKSIRISEMWCC